MVKTAEEMHLFVLWAKARFAEKRILDDMRKEVEVIASKELSWEEPALDSYRKFYGIALVDGMRKLRYCGAGPFLLIVVRDKVIEQEGYSHETENLHIHNLKHKYRKWAGGHFRVHSTATVNEFSRDILLLTGRTADEWKHGIPDGPLHPKLPDWWVAVSSAAPFKIGFYEPGEELEIENRSILLEGKFLNDVFYSGNVLGKKCMIKHSSVAVVSIENEYRFSAHAYARAPEVVPMPVAYWYSPATHSAFVATEWIDGPSLSEILLHEVTERQADGFADDIVKMADVLSETGIVHRDIFTDNFILGKDGHLKLIDWQLAVCRRLIMEDPWVKKHWKFHYVVFGVNHDSPPGHWNDVRAFIAVLDMFPQTDSVRAAKEKLRMREKESWLVVRPPLWIRVALAAYGVSLLFQMLVRRKGPKRDKIKRRLMTVFGRGGTDVDGRDPELLKRGNA